MQELSNRAFETLVFHINWRYAANQLFAMRLELELALVLPFLLTFIFAFVTAFFRIYWEYSANQLLVLRLGLELAYSTSSVSAYVLLRFLCVLSVASVFLSQIKTWQFALIQ